MGWLYQVNITGYAKCHTSIVLIAWCTDLTNGVPAQEPEKDVAYMRDGDDYGAKG